MTTFASLTATLDGWFDKPLSELPVALQKRVREDFFSIPWDKLSFKQRQSVARQWDYQNDPTTETDRHWWDFFIKKGALKSRSSSGNLLPRPQQGSLPK